MNNTVTKNCSIARLKKGFTLIEVMMALVVIAVLMVPILTLQLNLVQQIRIASEQYLRLLQAEELLGQADEQLLIGKTVPTLTKRSTNPVATYTYQLKKADTNPTFKELSHLWSQRVIISWRGTIGERQETLVTFVCKSPDDTDGTQEQKA